MTEISHHFPPDVRQMLVRAAATPLEPGDPMVRVRAIEEAIAYAQRRYPRLFRELAPQ